MAQPPASAASTEMLSAPSHGNRSEFPSRNSILLFRPAAVEPGTGRCPKCSPGHRISSPRGFHAQGRLRRRPAATAEKEVHVSEISKRSRDWGLRLVLALTLLTRLAAPAFA